MTRSTADRSVTFRLQWWSASRTWLDHVCRSRRTLAVVAVLASLQTALLSYTAYVHSPTLNEPAHLAAGIRHWQTGEFELYRVNPPLVRMVAAVPVLLIGGNTNWDRLHRYGTARADFVVGDDYIAANRERSFLLFQIARLACIPFAWLGGLVCFLWARDLYGPRAGLLAMTLWTFSPMVLGHAALITPDSHASTLFALSGYTFWRWFRIPAWSRAVSAGAALGAAQLAKTTFIVMYIVLPLFWCLARCRSAGEPGIGRGREGLQVSLILAISLFVTNLGYGFSGSLAPLSEYRFASESLSRWKARLTGDYALTWLCHFPLPFPRDYVLGIDTQRSEFENFGRPSYLRGNYQATGWSYYYLYGLLVKVPLGTWALLVLSLAIRCRQSRRVQHGDFDELCLVVPALALFLFVSSQTGFSEHLRYILPIAPAAFIWISRSVQDRPSVISDERSGKWWVLSGRTAAFERRPILPFFIAGSLTCSITSSLACYPHSLAYFNEFAGGPAAGPTHLLGSNFDWGQDLRYLKWWLDDHPDVQPVWLAYCGRGDPAQLGIRFAGTPPAADAVGAMPSLGPGWYAVSANFLYGYPWFAADGRGGSVTYEQNALCYFRHLSPSATAGMSIALFHVPVVPPDAE